MTMTPQEIVRDYTQARSKSKQIRILADFNQVTLGEICKVLVQSGIEGMQAPKCIGHPPKVDEEELQGLPLLERSRPFTYR